MLPFRVVAVTPATPPLVGVPELLRWASLSYNCLRAGEWALVSVPRRQPDDRFVESPHWLAGLRVLDEVTARQRWLRWSRIPMSGCHVALVCAAGPEERAGIEGVHPTPVPPQLELAHAAPGVFPHARLCAKCEGPVELYPGRGGRPRSVCETCEPPFWPRKGERWWLDGSVVIVLGSGMTRPETGPRVRHIRARRENGGHRIVLTGTEWRQRAQREAPTSDEEAA